MTTDQRRLPDIEAALDENRQRMGHTLDSLQYRLSGASMVERGREYLRVTDADEFVSNLGRSARRNPVPLTLLGISIGWLMLASSQRAGRTIARNTPDWNHGDDSGHSVSDAATAAGQQTKSAARNLRHSAGQAASSGQKGLDQASHAADRAQRSASHAAQGARRRASQAGQATRRGGARLADGAESMYRQQPLVSTALGLAFGAVIAASLPKSRSEDRAMGATRDDALASAQHTGREKARQAQSVAESAAEAARDAAKSEADRQGLRDHER